MSSIIDFENRLTRMHKHLSKWARRQNITCYRIFDCDLPKFDFVIDRYEDCLSVSDYRGEETVLREILPVISRVTGVPAERIFVRRREIQRGTSQYARLEEHGHEIVATEAGLRFKLNLSAYLDTGLFLDHRITRSMVRNESAEKDVLNLFAYTGSFTVYAAAGGARSTLTIDLSRTYCEWCRDNLELNGAASEIFFERDHRGIPDALKSRQMHRIVQTDVLQALEDLPAEQFDLAVLDPPSFSNSKRMDRTLDIQRDHAELINDVLRTLRPGGVLYFSNNLSKFKMHADKINAAIKDITRQTIPNDFRDPKVHHCFRIQKNPDA